jgi:drug/metabolite transporter (DMT)-like permease
MSWLWWVNIGYLLNALTLVVDKALLARREIKDPAVYTLSISLLGVLAVLLAPWGLEWPTRVVLALGLTSGACFTLGLWLMFIVLKVGEASRVPAFIGSLSPIFVFLFSAVLVGERMGMLEVVAFAFLVAGGMLMVGGHGGLNRRALILATLSAAVFALAYVTLKLTFDHTNFISGLVWSRLGGLVSSLLLLLIPGTYKRFRQSFGQSTGKIKLVFLGGQTAGALSGLFITYAITKQSVTLVNALQGLQYVFVLALAVLISWRFPQFFRDQFNASELGRKVAGTGAIAVGLWLVAILT